MSICQCNEVRYEPLWGGQSFIYLPSASSISSWDVLSSLIYLWAHAHARRSMHPASLNPSSSRRTATTAPVSRWHPIIPAFPLSMQSKNTQSPISLHFYSPPQPHISPAWRVSNRFQRSNGRSPASSPGTPEFLLSGKDCFASAQIITHARCTQHPVRACIARPCSYYS